MAQSTSSYKLLIKQFDEIIKGRNVIEECEFKVMTIDEIESNDRRIDVIEYFCNPSWKPDKKIRYIPLFYIILRDELYKQLCDDTLERCLGEKQAYDALAKRQGTCGGYKARDKYNRF